MSSFIEALRIQPRQQPSVTLLKTVGEDCKASRSRFVRGPIASDWLERAAQLPGKALHAAVAIQYLDGFQQTGSVKLRPSVRNGYGMDRFSCARALEHLEAAGLVEVLRKRGAAPTVTILQLAEQAGPVGRWKESRRVEDPH